MTWAMSLRCTVCLTNWPPTNEFSPCPECGERTDRISNADPIPVDEAMSRLKHARFEKYYADRCARQLNNELDAA